MYITNGAKVTITGGEFSGPNDWSGLAIEGTSAVVSGDNDVDLPTGSVILQGGKFSGKAYNSVTNTVYAPASNNRRQQFEMGRCPCHPIDDLKYKTNERCRNTFR